MPLQHVGLAHLFADAWRRDPSRFDPDIARQIERGLAWSGAEVARAREAGWQIALTLAEFFTRFDLLLCPTTPCVAWRNDRLGPERIGGVAVEPRGHAVFTPWVNHAMAAAISIPCGAGRDGLPAGLQLIAPRGHDRLLLNAARAAEFQFALEARTRRDAADSATARQGYATQLSFLMRIGITARPSRHPCSRPRRAHCCPQGSRKTPPAHPVPRAW